MGDGRKERKKREKEKGGIKGREKAKGRRNKVGEGRERREGRKGKRVENGRERRGEGGRRETGGGEVRCRGELGEGAPLSPPPPRGQYRDNL